MFVDIAPGRRRLVGPGGSAAAEAGQEVARLPLATRVRRVAPNLVGQPTALRAREERTDAVDERHECLRCSDNGGQRPGYPVDAGFAPLPVGEQVHPRTRYTGW
jgi:hypothetical protein